MERIWPLDDEARVFADGVGIPEQEQRGGSVGGEAVAPAPVRAPAPHAEAAPRRLTACTVLSRCLLRRRQPATNTVLGNSTRLRTKH